MRKSCLLYGGILAALPLVTRAESTNTSTTIPHDLSIRAQFFPGAGAEWLEPDVAPKLPKPWTLTITSNGKASQSVAPIHDPGRSLPLIMRPDKADEVSAEDMRAVEAPDAKNTQISIHTLQGIIATIKAAKFFALPSVLSTGRGEHSASIVLSITMDNRTHEIVFDWPNERFDRQGFLQFWRVWSEITRAVPSPNHNSELDYWAHASDLQLPK